MNVLILGDSHTFGSYGQELERLFKARGDTVTRVGRVGATAGSYVRGSWSKLQGTGDFDQAVKGSYDLAVLSLGTNDAAALSPVLSVEQAAGTLKSLADQLKTKALVYVGPPAFSATAAKTYNPVFKVEDLNSRAARLWQTVKSMFSTAIDPREVTKPFVLEKDIHLPAAGGKAWAQSVYESLTKPAALAKGPVGAGVMAGVLTVVVLGAFVLFRRSQGVA